MSVNKLTSKSSPANKGTDHRILIGVMRAMPETCVGLVHMRQDKKTNPLLNQSHPFKGILWVATPFLPARLTDSSLHHSLQNNHLSNEKSLVPWAFKGEKNEMIFKLSPSYIDIICFQGAYLCFACTFLV